MYIYESHLGDLYTSKTKLKDTYCKQCGDSDRLIGEANTRAKALELLKDDIASFDPTMCKTCPHNNDYDYCNNKCEDYQHSGGYNMEYIQEFLDENWKE